MNTKTQVKFTPLSYVLRWLFAACLVLFTYKSWSHVRRRLSGQYDVDDVEN